MKPYYCDDAVTLYHGDCLDVLAELPDASVDSVVTDPPYGLDFMGKHWDTGAVAFDTAVWGHCLRVLKPGGHMLAFGGTRTWHRLACAVEDAGFEIRDNIAWLYGSGFPKSLNVATAVDKYRADENRAELLPDEAKFCEWMREHSGLTELDAKRILGSARFITGVVEIVNTATVEAPRMGRRAMVPTSAAWEKVRPMLATEPPEWVEQLVKSPPTEQTLADWNPGKGNGTVGHNEWAGFGTALKPAFEPVVVARKPLAGTVAGNVLAHGVGALNIDGCRVGFRNASDKATVQNAKWHSVPNSTYGKFDRQHNNEVLDGADSTPDAGRWPSNVVIDGHAAAEIDRQSGHSKTPDTVTRGGNRREAYGMGHQDDVPCYGDEGGASRFFPTFRYQAKAATDERPTANGIAHPTVKPLDLMRWLIRLVTPPGGTVLEPFAGSGTTAEACIHEHMRCIAIEREADYLPLIVARLTKPIEIGFDFNT